MNGFYEILLKSFRRAVMPFFAAGNFSGNCITVPDLASESIIRLLGNSAPCMIARFGSVEMNAIQNYLATQSRPSLYNYLTGKSYQWWWNRKGIYELRNNAGFFPNTIDNVEKFCNLMINDAKDVDFLGSWLPNEHLLCPHLSNTQKTYLRFLEPFWSQKPWTQVLEGKNVLVIHPFAELFKHQYDTNREFLFDDKRILPRFNMIPFKAVQSLGGICRFPSWFDALEWMEEEISRIDFDIALIGCGAYGFPLAAFVKRSGKKAFHLGGVLQLLFGVSGNRWINPMYGVKEWGIPIGKYSSMMNDYWTKPGSDLCPENAKDVEDSCYW